MELARLSLTRDRALAEAFLARAGLRYEEDLTYLAGLYDGDALVAVGGSAGSVIKCLAVAEERRGEGLLNTLVSHLYARLVESGAANVYLFTKPENRDTFRSLGFYPVACAEQSMLLESRKNAVDAWARQFRLPGDASAIVMHANPFTIGHRYLIEQAASVSDVLHVFVLAHSAPPIPFEDRIRLVEAGTRDLPNVHVHAGGPYIISESTFPSYYLKRASDAARVHAELDALIFAERLAPAMGVTRRFAGTEPLDPMTSLYNDALLRLLPPRGVAVTVLDRLETGGAPVSASRVRALWQAGELDQLRPLVPEPTYRYLSERRP